MVFSCHVATLATSDPESIAFFDNSFFEEVFRHGDVDARIRPMVQLAVG